MRFYETTPEHDLTYSDVFLVPSKSTVGSRMNVDLSPTDGTGTSIPIVSANMNAVTGPRLAATLARRGGLGVMPQDLDSNSVIAAVNWVKSQPAAFDSPFLVEPSTTVAELKKILPPVDHSAFSVVDDGELLGVVTADVVGRSLDDAKVGDLVHEAPHVFDVSELADPADAFHLLDERGIAVAAVTEDGRLVGTLSPVQAMRSTVYRPALDALGRLKVAAAVGVNGDVAGRARALIEAGVDVLVLDTAHGHQSSMIGAVEAVRAIAPSLPLVAGNVVTAAGVQDLVEAGASIIKVGVGPGAMCTTRMMTAVGRPQFSAVLETAQEAATIGAAVWADGGVRYPRDVALALAAGGASVMIGSWFAGTIEAPGTIERAPDGRLFKESYGMASTKAVTGRFERLDHLELARKTLFSEGISSSRIFLDPARPSVEDLLDQILSGLRSSFTYAGARTVEEFHERALVGIQSAAGYDEGRALPESW